MTAEAPEPVAIAVDQRRPSWPARVWARLKSLFNPEVAEATPVVYAHLVARHESNTPIEVLARGGALAFRLFVAYRWESDGLDEFMLQRQMERNVPTVRREVRDGIRTLAIDHAPHRVMEMQDAVNAWADAYAFVVVEGRMTLSCHVTVQVVPDEQVRERLAAHWKRIIDAEHEHEYAMRRAHIVRDLTKQWSTIISELRDNPQTVHAARMSDERFAEVVDKLTADQRSAVAQLTELLEKAIDGHRLAGMGQFEFVDTYDKLVRKLQKENGI